MEQRQRVERSCWTQSEDVGDKREGGVGCTSFVLSLEDQVKSSKKKENTEEIKLFPNISKDLNVCQQRCQFLVHLCIHSKTMYGTKEFVSETGIFKKLSIARVGFFQKMGISAIKVATYRTLQTMHRCVGTSTV